MEAGGAACPAGAATVGTSTQMASPYGLYRSQRMAGPARRTSTGVTTGGRVAGATLSTRGGASRLSRCTSAMNGSLTAGAFLCALRAVTVLEAPVPSRAGAPDRAFGAGAAGPRLASAVEACGCGALRASGR